MKSLWTDLFLFSYFLWEDNISSNFSSLSVFYGPVFYTDM